MNSRTLSYTKKFSFIFEILYYFQVKVDGYVDKVFEHALERDDTIGGRFISVTPKSNRLPLQVL